MSNLFGGKLCRITETLILTFEYGTVFVALYRKSKSMLLSLVQIQQDSMLKYKIMNNFIKIK